MQKIYLLLRNNQQTGPYTLEEILTLNLKPFDLVWEEGRSAAWRYPSEIQSLEPYVKPTPKPETPFEPVPTSLMEDHPDQTNHFSAPAKLVAPLPKKVFVSMPGKKPAAVVLAASHSIEVPGPDPVIEKLTENPARQNSYSLQEDLYSEAGYPVREQFGHTTKKKVSINKKDFAILSGVLLVIITGYFMFSQKSEIKTLPTAKNITAGSVVPPSAVSQEEMKTDMDQQEIAGVANEAKPLEKNAKGDINLASSGNPEPPFRKQEEIMPLNEDLPLAQVPVENEKDEDLYDKGKTEEAGKQVTGAKKEKRKLKDIVKGIFSKRTEKKAEERGGSEPDEPRSAIGRKAQKRNEDQFPVAEPDHASLAEKIDLSSHSPENWMMGLKGLKVSLRNHNAFALQSALVYITYLDANNKVLEKKSIEFTNIPANGKITMPAPDHKWADHAALSLGNVTTRKDMLAKD